MPQFNKRGNRIRASDKSLVFRFSFGSLLLLFFAVVMLLNLKSIITTDWKAISLFQDGSVHLTIMPYRIMTIVVAALVCVLAALFYRRFQYDRVKQLFHRQKLARMLLENGWYESESTQDSGFFKDLPATTKKEKITYFPKLYYRMEHGLLYIRTEITLGKYQEQLLHLEKKLETGLYCELVSKELKDSYVEYVLLYDTIANRITIDEVQAENGVVSLELPDDTAGSATVMRYNEKGVPVGMYVWTLEYNDYAYEVTAQPKLTDLLTYHGFSIRITDKSGIRFKTGISADLRKKLLQTDGVDGYRLKEYGTLIMTDANRKTYPMVVGGQKVLQGMAYGTDASGIFKDSIYETVDNRYRYTSVLVGMPASQYKVDYAFRGYATLTKDGQDITIYGPVVAKNIYSLAEQLLRMKIYEEGSDADLYLRKLIQDADKQ